MPLCRTFLKRAPSLITATSSHYTPLAWTACFCLYCVCVLCDTAVYCTRPMAESQLKQDEEVLRELGYKQVLYRTWGTFTTVTIAISAMSVLTSITGARN